MKCPYCLNNALVGGINELNYTQIGDGTTRFHCAYCDKVIVRFNYIHYLPYQKIRKSRI